MDQRQQPSQPPNQWHVPTSFPPRPPAQPPGVPPSAVNQASDASSHSGHSAPPMYEYRTGPSPTVRHLPPLQAPMRALSSTVTTSQSFVNPLRRSLIPGSIPMASTHLNAQPGSYHLSHAGNPVVHQIRAPLAGPPWPDLSRNVPPPRLPPPPPIQGQTTYWQSPNSQAMLLGAAQGVLHSVPSSSGSLVHSIPRNPSSNASSLPLPSLPPGPLPSSSTPHVSSNLHKHRESEERTKSHGFGLTGLETCNDMMNQTQVRSDPPVVDESKRNDDGSGCKFSSFVGSGSTIDGSRALDVTTAPHKPTEEKVVQKIELLCQFIAKNGPGFEDMARNRESNNPEFKFLFGGERGSEAAIAHDYFQWLKKRHSSTVRFPEEHDSPSRHSEICSLRQPERLTMLAATSDTRADSDMEMEDDITQLPEDEETSKADQDLSCSTDFFRVKMDAKGPSRVVQGCVDDASPENVLPDKLPCPGGATFSDQGTGSAILPQQNHSIPVTLDEGHLNIDLTGSADSPKGGTIGESASFEDHNLSSSSVSEHANFGKSSAEDVKSPFKLLPEDSPDASLENNDKASHPGEHVGVVAQTALEIPTSVPENTEVDMRPEIPSKFVKAAGQLFGSTRTDRASTNSSQTGNELKETDASSLRGLTNENGDEGHDKGSFQAVPSLELEPFDQNRSYRSSEYNDDGPNTLKDNKDHNFHSDPTALKVDEFGRLIREGVSDSDSDDSDHASDHNRREINRGRGQSPGSRKWKGSSELKWREKRSLSRSWSPRRRRSRSRSPRRRKSRSRSPRRRRSRSRSPRRRSSRSRSPLRRAGEFRGDSMRRDRGRKPECFDFLRGRCYRGASCRYSHHDAEIDGSRYNRRKTQNTEKPSGLGHSGAIKETYDKSIGASKQVNDEVKKRESRLSSSMRDGCFGFQEVAERTDLDNVENDGQRAADKSQESAVQDEVKGFPTGIPPTTKFNQEEEIHRSLSVDFCCQPMSDADAMTNGKTLDIHFPVKVSMEPFQVNADAVASANPVPGSMDSSLGLKPSWEKNLTSSPVTSLIGTNVWNFPKDQNVGSGASYLVERAQQEAFSSTMIANSQPHVSSARPSCTLNSMLASDVSGDTATHGGGGSATHAGYAHYQHSHVPPSSTFISQASFKPYPSLRHSEDQRPSPLPSNIPPGEHFVAPGLAKEALHSNMNPSPAGVVPLAELSKLSHVHSFLPQYGLQYTGDTSGMNMPRQLATPLYPQDRRDINQTSVAPDYGVCRVTPHYNPCASTLGQPPVSRFSADDIPPQHYSSQHNTPQGIQGAVSVQTCSSVKPVARVHQTLAPSGGDRYDPLFDSMEPSSNSVEKVDLAQKQESIYDSDVMLSLSGSNKPMDVEENNQKKEIEAFMLSTSLDDDGFGETADAQVGDVESPSNHLDETNDTVGEVEIDQVKSPGKSKKRKESRSMKLFKIALANFVKEVLRPSWRQGNMSKEAFKTIVKKVVDKVTSTMKSHHIPKSHSKIDHYIDSSHRKLTKLVMGYVDKFVKV